MPRGQKIATAFLELGVDDRRLDRDVSQLKRKVNSSFADLARAATSAFAAFGISSFFGDATKEATKLEVLKVQFETLSGSAEEASRLIEKLRGFRDVSPFTLEQLAENSKLLLAYGLEARKVVRVQQQLGDISGGSTEKLKRLSVAFGQVRAKGRLMGQEVIQMTESGFNPLQEIARTTGTSIAVLIKEMENGRVGFNQVEEAIRTATLEGGRFFNLIGRFQGTTQGSIARLAGRFQELQVVVGQILLPAKRALVETSLDLVNAFLALSPEMQKVLTITVALAPAILSVAAAFKVMQFAGISAAVGIRAALLATGIGALLPLIGFVIAKFIDLSQTIDVDLKPVLEALASPIRKFQRAWEVAWEAINTILKTVTTAIKSAFSALFGALGADIREIKNNFVGFVTFTIDLIAGFVLEVAEWFNVIVHNWGTALDAMGDASRFMWSSIGDVISNFIPAAWEMIKGFAASVVEVFSSIPDAIKTVFQGGGIAGALDELFAEATAKFAASQVKAFSSLLTPSEETKRLSMELQATLAKLAAAKKKLESERNKVGEEIEDAEEVVESAKEESDKKKEAVKEKIEIELGRTGLTDFANEVQDMFLNNEADDMTAKIIDLNQAQVEIQDEALGVNKEIRDELKNTAVIRVAGQ